MDALIAPFPFAWFAQARQRGEKTFLLIDSAVDRTTLRTIYELDNDPQCIPLFFQDRYREMRAVSPLLVAVDEWSAVTHWFLNNKMFFNAGFFVSSQSSIEDVAFSFINCLDAESPEGEYLMFRVYDPVIMAALLLDTRAKDLPRIVDKSSSVLVNYYDSNNQNIWGEFYKKEQGEKYSGEPQPILFDDVYSDIFDSKRIRHTINKHAIAWSGLLGRDLVAESRFSASSENTFFSITPCYAKHSVFVSDDLYDETAERLVHYEEAYGIDNFTYLAECDLLLSQAPLDGKYAMNSVLLKKEKFIGDRLYLCEQILEKYNGGN